VADMWGMVLGATAFNQPFLPAAYPQLTRSATYIYELDVLR